MWANYLGALMALMAQLPSLIQTAEVAFSGAPVQSGKAKMAFVMGAAAAGLNAYQTVSPHPLSTDQTASIQQTIGTLAEATVQTMKTVGLLKTSTAVPSPPVVN